MHKYEFYGEWDNCDFYWDTKNTNYIPVEVKTELPDNSDNNNDEKLRKSDSNVGK